jgi:hypothetical protein
MAKIDVVQQVRDGKARFEWAELISEHNGYKLFLSVLRDAMKFDQVPALTWDWKPVTGAWATDELFDGVRLPATAHQLQEIADLIGGMLLPPKIIDLIWLKAPIKFDSVVNTPRYPGAPASQREIVAISPYHVVHQEIEAKIAAAGGDDGVSIISCVGKYWCLIQQLINCGMLQGDWTACNYGWFAKVASGPGLTAGTQCWQRPGYRHNKQHWDPSQTIRLMYRRGMLVRPDGTEEDVDLHDVAQDPELCGLLAYDGKPLTYLRQKGVEELEPLPTHGIITLPEVTIFGRRRKSDDDIA